MGYAYQGQECPPHYSAYNTVEWLGGGASGLGLHYGPNMYCQAVWSVVDIWHDKPGSECGAGNPIFPLTGTKRQSEDVLRWSPTLPPLSITYDNRRKLPNSDPEGAFSHTPSPSFGNLWESNAHKRFVIQVGNSSFGSYYANVQASRGSGTWVSFIRKTSTGEPQAPDSDVADRVGAISGGWRYVDAKAQSLETYTGQGELTSVAYARGNGQTSSYSDSNTPVTVAPTAGLLIRIQDPFGRAVRFEYEQPAGVAVPRIVRIIDPDGQVIQAGYDAAGNLSQLNWPDGHVRKFLYEQSALPWALTGIIDENGERHSTYAYDGEGRAVSTEYAGGVNRYSVSYGSPPRWVTKETFDSTRLVFWRDHNWQYPQDTTLTTPNGTAVNLGATLINGMPRVTTRSQPAGAGCDASSSSLSYDANGNIASKTDFNGIKSCHVHDLGRNLETTRIEGLGGADACPVDLSAYTIPADAPQRKTTTQWHPDWSLPARQAEPKQITTRVYNGQPDPTAGNATASCAPASAVLPDGKPIAVLCKKVEQATTDATGSLGFAGTPEGVARLSTWTYNQHGQMLTARDPRNRLTAYAYYGDTTADHTTGDLQSMTDSNGGVTQYTRYDKSGRLLQSIDANGTVTNTSYTPRGWVKTVTVTPPGAVAQITVYDYDGVGQLKKATLPDGMALEYTYDAAHRLTAVKDSAGNSVTYTLDNMGNRTGEDLKDPNGTLARNITRVFDTLNRVESTQGTAQ
jgi:YD repeat-containing protein